MTAYRIMSPIHNFAFQGDQTSADERFEQAVSEARVSTAIPANGTVELHEQREPNIAGETRILRVEPINHRQAWKRFRFSPIPWRSLSLFDGDGDALNDPETIARYLREFRDTGAMNTVFFGRMDLPHETDESYTWGPASPADVDWTGFPHTNR